MDTRLPEEIRAGVEAGLEEATGRTARLVNATGVGGGCISPVARVTTDRGDEYFLKWAEPGQPAGLLAAEARGLRTLAATNTVTVPAIIATPDTSQWLLLEWLEPTPPGRQAWEELGADLAALHEAAADRYGDEADNFIGTLPQTNRPTSTWPEFWRDRRLSPQLERAVSGGYFDASDQHRFTALLDALPTLLAPADEEGPAILHGDLWSGNVHFTRGGAALVDPSVYRGHREVDLAMSELFGGFGPGFRDAYDAAWPLAPGYTPVRRAVYQLYYLLVHVNLFGAGYVSGCRSALSAAGF